MSITIRERPEGHILDTTEKTATVSESYGAGDAQFVVPTVHGLVDGDYIYSVSDIEDYAGFFYVDVITTGIFKLRLPGGSYAQSNVQFIAAGSITYYESNLNHGWSAVHLPITYRLFNNLFPTNSNEAAEDILSVTNLYGYSIIHLNGNLGTGINSFDFIKLTVPNDTEVSGIYQIIEFISPTVLIINLEYDASINWTGSEALKHYNNYNMVVRVYAGLNSSHQWASVKPYELAATLELIPDDNNECFFSINEILKSYITTRNNTLLGTLPTNIDFMTMFYIETAEKYDDSDGYTFGTTITPAAFTSDQANFEGMAINAKLDFKNIYSGYLSEYLMTNTAAKFLTLFSIPVLFIGCTDEETFNVSFLNPYDSSHTLSLRQAYYNNGDLVQTIETPISNPDKGIIRVFLENATCEADAVRCTVIIDGVPDLVNGEFTSSGDGWTNSGTGETWAYSSGDIRVEVTGSQSSKRWEQDYDFIADLTYSISFTITISGTDAAGWFVRARASNDDYSVTQAIAGGGPYTSDPGVPVVISTTSFTPTQNYTKIYFIVEPNIP